MGWRRIGFRGCVFWFDGNSLEVAVGEEPPVKEPAPERQHQGPAAPQRPQMLVFNLTHSCNLACDYCFVRNDYPPGPPSMPLLTALRGLGLLAPRRDFNISFFGGEPLLEWPTLVHVTLAAKAMAEHSGAKARLHVTTNGTLLDEEKAGWLNANGFSLIVSLDGPPEIHDGSRPMREGANGSFAAVIKGLEAVRKFPHLAARTTLRGTFTAARLDLVERVEFLNRLCDAGYAANVSLEPASLVAEGCAGPRMRGGHPQAFKPKDMKRLRDEYDALADWWLERQRSGKKPRFFHFEKMLERLKARRPACSDCGAGWGYMCVNPAGEIHACHREGNRLGDVYNGISEASRAEWLDNRYYARHKCPACWARNFCGGGCRKDSSDKFGNLKRPDPLSCAMRIIWLLEAAHLYSIAPPTSYQQRAISQSAHR